MKLHPSIVGKARISHGTMNIAAVRGRPIQLGPASPQGNKALSSRGWVVTISGDFTFGRKVNTLTVLASLRWPSLIAPTTVHYAQYVVYVPVAGRKRALVHFYSVNLISNITSMF